MSDDFEYQLQQEFQQKLKDQQINDNNDNNEINSKTYRDPNDGTEYEWNPTIKGWVPKIDDDLIAKYQSNYGYTVTQESGDCVTTDDTQTEIEKDSQSDDTNCEATANEKPNSSKKPFVSKLLSKRKAEPQNTEWFEVLDEHNTKVYVNNLPLDTTEEEFLQLMKKCGLIEKDERNEFKLKLYRDANGQLKGDGLCTYIKIESVELALNILDGYQFKDKIISVERAKFALKGQFDPSLKPKRKKRDKLKEKKKTEKLLDWRPEPLARQERPKSEKTVIIKNMFEPKEFLSEPKLILEYRSDLRDECSEKCGQIKRVDIYDCHPEGVAAVTFTEFQSADQCVQLMNGRFFAGRRLSAHHWDGMTKYKIQETEEEAEQRLKQWEQFLESENH